MNIHRNVIYREVRKPKADCTNSPVLLTDETMQERYEKVLCKMADNNLDSLIIYADLEHGSNFEYLTGFLPRFEEALLVIHKNGENYMMMGNENLNKVSSARIQAKAIHVPYFSLPNQPMDNSESFVSLLRAAEISEGKKIGLVGWKLFTSSFEDNTKIFDVPCYIVDGIREIAGENGQLINAAALFIGNKGVRCINNVNEIEHYEFGAALASDCILKTMDLLEEGISETALGETLNALGQKNSVVTIAAAGKRFVKANIYPTDNKVKTGDTISLTIGYKGGLSSRAGYAVQDEPQLPEAVKDYVEVVVKPYYNAVAEWLERIHCKMTGDELYQHINQVLPKSEYHWSLCPGHLTADEEWMSSPVYAGSKEILESGMLFQIDIIPSVPGYGGTSAESTVALADDNLRKEIQKKAPDLWERILRRREYMEQELNIRLNPDVLPMCSTVAYLRPLLLNKEKAMTIEQV